MHRRYRRFALLSAAVFWIAAGGWSYAAGGQHPNPLSVLDTHRPHTPPAAPKKSAPKTSGRHFSPLDALNGKIVVREKPAPKPVRHSRTRPIRTKAARQRAARRPQSPSQQEVLYLDLPPGGDPLTQPDVLPEPPAAPKEPSRSASDVLNGIPPSAAPKTRLAAPERPHPDDAPADAHGEITLPPASRSHSADKHPLDLIITETEGEELPVGEHLTPVKALPLPKTPPRANKHYHTARQKILYLTFDDGPVGGTANLIKALREEGVEATFFFIGREVVRSPQLFRQALAQPNLLIANHTYTHADNHYRRFYNSPTPRVIADIDKAQSVIGGAKYLRLCGRDVWRLPATRRNDWAISVAQRGREIAKYDALYNRGYFIYGWDVEWLFSHKTQRPVFNGEEMARRVNLQYRSGKSAQPGKIVLLAHDFMFRNARNVRHLRTFIHIMKAQGWKFETIDTYSRATPDANIRTTKIPSGNLRPAQKIAKKATVLLPPNRPTVTIQAVAAPHNHLDLATQLSRAIRKQSFIRIRRLLAQGADINAKDPQGEIPLNIAIRTNNAVLVRMLVERGARIFNLDANGMSPMGVARENNNTIIVRYLHRQIAQQQKRRLRQTLFASNESIPTKP